MSGYPDIFGGGGLSNFRSFDELNNSPASDPFTSTVNAVRRVVCPLYNQFPGLFRLPSSPTTNVPRAAQRAFFEGLLCPPPPPIGEPPPNVYAPGCDVIYDVTIIYQPKDGGAPISQVRSGSNLVRAEGYPVGNDRVRLDMFRVNGENVGRFYIANNVPPSFPGFDVLSVSMARRDGLPLTTPCTVPPVVDPVLLFPPNVYINVGGNQFEVEINPVTYEFGGDTYFSPQFNTSLGPIEFDLGGVNFGPFFLPPIISGPPGGGGATPADVQNIVNNQNNIQTTNISNILEDNSAALADYIRCLVERPNESVESVPLTGNSSGGDFVLPDNCFAVAIGRRDPIGPGTRIQAGSNGLPNVEFWGWYAIGRNGNYGVREPLSYQDTVVPVTERFNEIRINPTFANSFNATALRWVNNCVFEG